MRKWCAILAVAAWLALPLCAQQRAAGTVEERSTAESAAANSAAGNDFRIAPASSNLFTAASPASAAAGGGDIFSDWANNAWNRHSLARPGWRNWRLSL